MKQRKIYVIIVTYNGMKWIDNCLSSLLNSTEKGIPIIIDNCSIDGTVDYVREHFPEVIIIQNKENVGFGHANNQGIEYAYNNGGTHFFLLNQDAYVYPDTITEMADIQDKYGIALVSPIHLNGKGDVIDQQFFEYSVVSEHNREMVSDFLLDNTKEYYYVGFVNAVAWMMTRNCVEKIGGFDPIFFIYGEDSNYCQRIQYHKERLGVVPKALIRHDREIHGNVKSYNKRAVLSLLLKTYANINEPFIKITKNRIAFHFWMLKNSIVYLCKLKFRDWWYIIAGYGTYISMIPKVIKSRKKNIQVACNYLDLERENING